MPDFLSARFPPSVLARRGPIQPTAIRQHEGRLYSATSTVEPGRNHEDIEVSAKERRRRNRRAKRVFRRVREMIIVWCGKRKTAFRY